MHRTIADGQAWAAGIAALTGAFLRQHPTTDFLPSLSNSHWQPSTSGLDLGLFYFHPAPVTPKPSPTQGLSSTHDPIPLAPRTKGQKDNKQQWRALRVEGG